MGTGWQFIKKIARSAVSWLSSLFGRGSASSADFLPAITAEDTTPRPSKALGCFSKTATLDSDFYDFTGSQLYNLVSKKSRELRSNFSEQNVSNNIVNHNEIDVSLCMTPEAERDMNKYFDEMILNYSQAISADILDGIRGDTVESVGMRR